MWTTATQLVRLPIPISTALRPTIAVYSGTASACQAPSTFYTASHPENFATYQYRLSRGVALLTPPSTSGQQVSAATNPALVAMSVANLLTLPDGTVCDVAGFAADLYVWATATDGWDRLSGYDSSPPLVGFALAPKVLAPPKL